MDELPRDNLTRSVPFHLERADAEGDGLTLEGYGAVFDVPTRIDSWDGGFDEQIARGAFADSLRERTPKLQFDHGQHALVGSIPLGVIKRMREDDRGLYVEARLHDNWLIQPVRDAIASGAVDGMSFRFRVPEGGDTWQDRTGDVPMRTITRADVVEVGPVVWPAYQATTVGVRSQELARLFDLPEQERIALARALALGAPLAVGQGEPEHPGSNEDEQAVGRSLDPQARSRALALLNL
jgi:HK97 family phage prohead protease